MSEDWEEHEIVMQPVRGRSFGSRGRGFRPAEKTVGLPGRKYENLDKENWDENVSDHGNAGFQEEYPEENDARKSRRKDEGPRQKSDSKKYVPKEISNDELFSHGIKSGINFNKYDDIQVKVTGENIPKEINDFNNAGLCDLLLTNVKKCAYVKPTPIQKHSLPIIMSGRDMMACAQTGSGKTAAFLIPIINDLLKTNTGPEVENAAVPKLLVIAPTRELSIQTYIEARKFSYGSKIKTEIAYGGTAVKQQGKRIRDGCDILIGTPGRLKDFLNKRYFVLDKLRYLVLDEADELLMGNFLEEIEFIFKQAKSNFQTVMFSATFPIDVQILASKKLTKYVFLAVGIVGGACSDVEQRFYLVSQFEKRQKLIDLLDERGSDKTLVFVGKKRTADIIAAYLSEKDYPATSMHGGRDQMLREEAIRDFKSGKMDLLVATAVAARGLDIQNVAHVINYDLPNEIDEYIHRIGRTGRVGNRGLATSFYDPKIDSKLAPDLVRILTQAEQEVPDFLLTAGAYSSRVCTNSKFGGSDIRNKRGIRGSKIDPLEAAPTYEEEHW